jgi:hypothetical protein
MTAEPAGTGRRHNGMLNTLSPNDRKPRAGRARPGAALAAGAAVLAAGLSLAGCSGQPGASAASSSNAVSSAAAQPASEPASAPADGSADGTGGTAGTPARAAGQQAGPGTTARLASASDIIYTAQLTERAQDVPAAAGKATQLAQDAGGYVSGETAAADPEHPSQATATVQLKIPVAAYAATLAQLASGLGTRLSLQEQAQDVTQQVADVNSQVTSDQAAIAQLRALLAHAGSVGDLLSVQNQINTEETALESMQAQQRALVHQTSYATVALTILGPKAAPVVHPAKSPPSVASGLAAGWRALKLTVSWVLAVLGAVAPFAVLAAVAAFAFYRARRWLIRRRPASRPAAPDV